MKKVSVLALLIIIILASSYSARHFMSKNPTLTKVTPIISANGYGYPVANFDERLAVRGFGQYVQPGDEKKLECGKAFQGYHTGDDLEILKGEEGADVPVLAITDGIVKDIGWVNGYGGLVVLEHRLGETSVTAYYGHLAIGSVGLRAGEKLGAGAKIGILGKSCTAETDFERKHLHFAIRKGAEVDVRGYVQSKEELSPWLDPQAELSRIGARDFRVKN